MKYKYKGNVYNIYMREVTDFIDKFKNVIS